MRNTKEITESFLKFIENKNGNKATLASYRTAMNQFYSFCGDGGTIDGTTFMRWKDYLVSKGLSSRTINQRLSILNSYLVYLGHREWVGHGFLEPVHKEQVRISRDEYRRLLAASKTLEKMKCYLIIKLIGGFGFCEKDICNLLVKDVISGKAKVGIRGEQRVVEFSGDIKYELEGYIRENGIRDGAVFLMPSGEAIDRRSVHYYVNCVARDARVDIKKATPKCLYDMYCETHNEIRQQIEKEMNARYNKLLEHEQKLYGYYEVIGQGIKL